MLASIAQARESINLEIYIFDHGVIAGRFAEALAERARAGIEVRILVDGWGSDLGPLEPALVAAGAQRPHLQAPAHLLDRPRRQPDPSAHPDHRRQDRLLRRRGDRRPVEGRRARPLRVEGHDDPHRGTGRHAAAARVRAGLGPHDGRGLERRPPVSRDRARRADARAGDRGRPRRRDLDVEARPLHGDSGGAPQHLDRERLLRARPPDPRGPGAGRAARGGRQGDRARRAHGFAQRPHGGALPLRRVAPGGRRDLRVPPDDDAQQGDGGRPGLVHGRLDQLRQPLDEEERRGQHRRLRQGVRGGGREDGARGPRAVRRADAGRVEQARRLRSRRRCCSSGCSPRTTSRIGRDVGQAAAARASPDRFRHGDDRDQSARGPRHRDRVPEGAPGRPARAMAAPHQPGHPDPPFLDGDPRDHRRRRRGGEALPRARARSPHSSRAATWPGTTSREAGFRVPPHMLSHFKVLLHRCDLL